LAKFHPLRHQFWRTWDKDFDLLQQDGKHFICRIKIKTPRTVVKQNPVDPGSYVFYDSVVLLGTPGSSQSEKPVRVVGYEIEGVKYFIATDRHDLTGEQIATAYKLRWRIETFSKWWEKHLKVYHLIVRSEYGLMVQILGGLITYLLMAIYCRTNFNEPVSIKRVRELRFSIRNELYGTHAQVDDKIFKEPEKLFAHAKT